MNVFPTEMNFDFLVIFPRINSFIILFLQC